MISQVNMLVVLFNNILDRRMINLGEFKPAKEPFDPTKTIKFIIDVFSQQANIQDSTLQFKIVETPVPHVEPLSLRNLGADFNSTGSLPQNLFGDHKRLQQVLVNLLRNALRFSRSMPVYVIAAYDRYSQKLII